MGFVGGHVIVDTIDEVSMRIEDGEAIAVENQGFLPNGEDRGIRWRISRFEKGIWVYLGHFAI